MVLDGEEGATITANIVLRADASTQIGAGHVMRCLALAQAWQDAGGAAHFAAVELPDGLATRLTAEGMALHRLDVVPGSPADAAQTAALAQRLRAAWVVEDGYHFAADFQRTIKEADLCLLVIDDYGHAGHYVADLVLNQNICADAALYPSRSPETRLLLGTQYVLLRREFLRWCGWHRHIPHVARKVLVTMGGSDPDNMTLKVIEALEQVQVDGLEVVVVAGAGNPHLSALQGSIQLSQHQIRLKQNVIDMSGPIVWADVAVSGVGSTCWEFLFMGLPMIGYILAENQRHTSMTLFKHGLIRSLGDSSHVDTHQLCLALTELLNDASCRHRISLQAPQVVDGLGASRVVASILAETIS